MEKAQPNISLPRGHLAMAVTCAVIFLHLGCAKKEASLQPLVSDHGPHGGHTFQMSSGTGFTFEFTQQLERQRIVLYVLDSKSRGAHPISAGQLESQITAGNVSFDINFIADPRSSDPKGKSSRFAVSLNRVPQQLMDSNQFRLTVWYNLNDETLSASLTHQNDHIHSYHHD